jgi:integrase
MIKLAMLTGLRRGEIFKLQDRDLDFRHHLIRVRDPKGGKSAPPPMVASFIVTPATLSHASWSEPAYAVLPGLTV